MPPATPIRREKIIDEDGNILELVIWRCPRHLTARPVSGTAWHSFERAS